MAADLITSAELATAYGSDFIEAMADRDRDGTSDAGVVSNAISAASEIVRSHFRKAMSDADVTGLSSAKRLTEQLAYVHLRKLTPSTLDASVDVIEERAMDYLRRVSRGEVDVADSADSVTETALTTSSTQSSSVYARGFAIDSSNSSTQALKQAGMSGY